MINYAIANSPTPCGYHDLDALSFVRGLLCNIAGLRLCRWTQIIHRCCGLGITSHLYLYDQRYTITRLLHGNEMLATHVVRFHALNMDAKVRHICVLVLAASAIQIPASHECKQPRL